MFFHVKDGMLNSARASPATLKGLLPKCEAPLPPGSKTLVQRQERHLAVRHTVD